MRRFRCGRSRLSSVTSPSQSIVPQLVMATSSSKKLFREKSWEEFFVQYPDLQCHWESLIILSFDQYHKSTERGRYGTLELVCKQSSKAVLKDLQSKLNMYIDEEDDSIEISSDGDQVEVEVCEPENCNAILFILQTYCPVKLFLKVGRGPYATLSFNIVNKLTKSIGGLNGCKLSHGKAKRICSISNVSVFFYEFCNTVHCSGATEDNLPIVHDRQSPRNFNFVDLPHCGLAFFFPEEDNTFEIFRYSEGKVTHPELVTIPRASENKRTQALFFELSTLLHEEKHINVEMYSPPGFTRKFCEFTGGGDLTIYGKVNSVVIMTTMETDSDDDLNLSHAADGEVYVSTVLENKIASVDFEKMAAQLQANMIVSMTKTLFDGLCEKTWSLENVVNCKVLTTYGIVCARVGTFGVLKLRMNFEEKEMLFECISPICDYLPSDTVRCLDSAIQYAVEQLKMSNKEDIIIN